MKKTQQKEVLSIREMVLFSFLGTLMFIGKKVMEPLPNIHPVALLVMVYTLVYRWKALWPIYIFVFLTGLVHGFAYWWYPYTYVWIVLWGLTMVLPKAMPPKVAPFVYVAVCGFHGFIFGTLWAPLHAVMFHLRWQGMIGWIIQGIPADITHGLGNVGMGLLIVPLQNLLRKQKKNPY